MAEITQGQDRYVIGVEGAEAGFTQYVDHDGRRVFFHTVVDDAYAGQGLAGQLVAHALDDTRTAGLRVVPVCSYVKKFVEKHSEYADLVETPTRADLDAIPQ